MNVNLKDKTIRLVNASITDVLKGRLYPEKTDIVILNDKIVSMPGLEGENDITADYEIDLQGKTVIPGIINTHTHLQQVSPSVLFSLKTLRLEKKYREKQIEKRMSDCIEHGVTIVRDSGTFYHRLSENRKLKERIDNGKIPGPEILQSVIVNIPGNYQAERLGFFLDLVIPLIGMGLKFSDPESSVVVFRKDSTDEKIRQAVDTAIDERKADYIKLAEQKYHRLKLEKEVPGMSSRQMALLTEYSHSRGRKTTMHHIESDSFRHAVEAGVYSIAHMPFDRVLSDEEVRLFIESPCLIEPTLSGIAFPGIWDIRRMPETNHPYIRQIIEYKNSMYNDFTGQFWIGEFRQVLLESKARIENGRLKTGLMDAGPILRKFASGLPVLVENTDRLIDAGAISRMSFANDGGFLLNDANIGIELDMLNIFMELKNKSLNGADALRIATINGAKSLGIENEYGSVETGKKANLAVISGNPLNDYKTIGQKVSALFKDGRLVVNNCSLQIKSRIRLISRSQNK